MPYLSPPTLTTDEQRLILRATAKHHRDHLIISMALGTGLRLCELVGLNVGDVYAPNGTPRVRVQVRREIAKGGRAGDVFLPDRLVPKLARLWTWKNRRSFVLRPVAAAIVQAAGAVHVAAVAGAGGVRPAVSVSLAASHVGDERLSEDPRSVPGATVCPACVAVDDDGLHSPER